MTIEEELRSGDLKGFGQDMVLLIRIVNSLRLWVALFALIPVAALLLPHPNLVELAAAMSLSLLLTGWVVTGAMRRIYLNIIREQRNTQELFRLVQLAKEEK